MFNLTAKQNVDQAPYVSIEKQDRAMRPPMFKQNSPKTKPNSPKATKKSKKQFIKPIPKVVLPKWALTNAQMEADHRMAYEMHTVIIDCGICFDSFNSSGIR